MKKIAILCAVTLLSFFMLGFLPVHGEEKIYNDVLRLHVIANSDSKEDQALKLKVRDAVIQECERVTIKETSREGDGRIKNNPMFFLYKEMADLLQRNLRALNMNKELTKGRDDKVNDDEADPLALLMKEQKEDD